MDFRALGMHDVMTLGRYQYAHAHRPLRRHTHGDMFEICLLDEGVQQYVVEDETYTLRGGDVLVTLPNERHGTGDSPERRGRLYWLLIRKPSARERFLNLPAAEGRALLDALLNLSPRVFRGSQDLKGYLESMFAAHDAEISPFRKTEIRNWALRFLLEILHDARAGGRRLTRTIRDVQDVIEERLFEQKPLLAELAELVGLSESRFKQRFKEEVGIAPGNYITQRKIEKARELLSASDVDITDLAFDLGFSSSQYFATTFRRYVGVTPSEYRRQNAR